MRPIARLLILALLVAAVACAPKEPREGYRPPIAANGLARLEQNWKPVRLLSGYWGVTFEYADGDSVSLNAEMFIEPSVRSRYDLISSRGNEAIVTVTPDFINLLNLKEKYFLREQTTPENAERLVGLYLPAPELADILCGRGFNPERFSQVFTDPAEGGGWFLRLFHKTEPMIASGYIDAYGRLRSILYRDSATDAPIIRTTYSDFRLEEDSGLVYPGHILIELMRRGERIVLDDSSLDVNDTKLIASLDSRVFVRLETGERVHMQDVPPGPPLLYRSVKEYVRKTGARPLP